MPVIVNGGEGNDLFDDMEQTNLPGPFARTFNGDGGDDFFRVGVQSGMPHEYQGGAGTDFVSYDYRSLTGTLPSPKPVVGQTITLDDVANDGVTGRGRQRPLGHRVRLRRRGRRHHHGHRQRRLPHGLRRSRHDQRARRRPTPWSPAQRRSATARPTCSNGAEGEDTLWLGGHTTANAGPDNDRFVTAGVDCAGVGDVAHGGDGIDQADFGLRDGRGPDGEPRRRGQRRLRRRRQLRRRYRGPVRWRQGE